jgi:drug/metabolite transporter (DMT)-like permease
LAKNTLSAVLGLLTGALVWGLIWYPFRLLEDAGVAGIAATLITYAIALAAALALFRHHVGALLRPDALLILIGLAAGWTNVAYVLGMLHGEVMQVLLLFYLAPLWTLLFARLLLGERAGLTGFLIVVLSLAGAATMLWQPGMRTPVPHTGAEWFGLSAGFTFALSNVLIRKASHHPIAVKAMASFAGVVVIAAALLPLAGAPLPAWPALAAGHAPWLLPTIGVVLLATNLAVQHGLDNLSANQAIVILLSELVVAAVSAYLLAGESMRWNEWAGGAMIVAATLLSGRLAAAKHA